MDTAGVLELMREVSAEVIEPRFRALHDDDIDQKHPGDYVTVADRQSEERLTAALLQAFPGCTVIGEEAVFGHPELLDGIETLEHAFFVDPVDGTRNFVQGSENFGVMVAEVRNGEATRAWILQPVKGQAFIAERGAGLWQDGQRVQRRRRHEGAPVGMASWSLAQGFDDHATLPPAQPTLGSCAIDYPLVATGEYDWVSYVTLNPWDHLPGTLMVREAGGVSRTVDGRDYRVGVSGSVLVTAQDEQTWSRVAPVLPAPR